MVEHGPLCTRPCHVAGDLPHRSHAVSLPHAPPPLQSWIEGFKPRAPASRPPGPPHPRAPWPLGPRAPEPLGPTSPAPPGLQAPGPPGPHLRK